MFHTRKHSLINLSTRLHSTSGSCCCSVCVVFRQLGVLHSYIRCVCLCVGLSPRFHRYSKLNWFFPGKLLPAVSTMHYIRLVLHKHCSGPPTTLFGMNPISRFGRPAVGLFPAHLLPVLQSVRLCTNGLLYTPKSEDGSNRCLPSWNAIRRTCLRAFLAEMLWKLVQVFWFLLLFLIFIFQRVNPFRWGNDNKRDRPHVHCRQHPVGVLVVIAGKINTH